MKTSNNPESTITIIGSGPAGAIASLFLSKYKIPHTLLEKASFPRDKICGDGLSGKVVSVLKKLDPSLVEEISKEKDHFLGSWGVLFFAPNRKKLEIPFKKDMSREPHPPGFVCKRMHLDQFLFEKTKSPYANRIVGAEVSGFVKKADGIELTYIHNGITQSVSADLIIAADGERSLTRRFFFNREFEPGHFYAGVRGYYKGVTGMHPMNFIELHFIKDLLPGYFWIFPLPGGAANVGVCILSSRARKEKMNLREIMLRIIAQDPAIKTRFTHAVAEDKIAGWGLPLGSKKQTLSTDHVLLTGDAASLIDPFTGEGIGNAMYSGMLAAQTARDAISTGQFHDSYLAEHYDKVLYAAIGDELNLSHTMQKLCRKSWLFNFVASRAEKNATLRETISCMFEDLDMRARLRDPKYYIKLLFNQ